MPLSPLWGKVGMRVMPPLCNRAHGLQIDRIGNTLSAAIADQSMGCCWCRIALPGKIWARLGWDET